MQVQIDCEGPQFLDCIRDCVNRDESVIRALKELGSKAALHSGEWEERDGLVLFRGKVYVPLDGKLQHDIVEAHHGTPVTRHPGQWKTTELVARNYWWPGMGQYISKCLKVCNLCNRTEKITLYLEWSKQQRRHSWH